MVEIKDLRVGDRIKLNDAKVTQILNEFIVVRVDNDTTDVAVTRDAIASILPRQLKVGRARLRDTHEFTGDILMIFNDFIWFRRDGYKEPCTYDSKRFENIPEDTP